MARYKERDEIDLAWSALRREATARVDLKLKAQRERELNKVLSQLQRKFTLALSRGELLELEADGN